MSDKNGDWAQSPFPILQSPINNKLNIKIENNLKLNKLKKLIIKK